MSHDHPPVTTTDPAPQASRLSPWVVGGALLGSIVLASVGNAVVAAIAHAAGASDDFRPLEPGTFVFLTAIGVLVGALGWWLVGRTTRGASTLRWLAPVVLVLSFVPDLAVGVTDSQPHTTWTGIIALMAMHLVVAAVALPVYARVLPVHRNTNHEQDPS